MPPFALAIVAIVEALATASFTTVPRPLWKNSRMQGPCSLEILRAADTGGGTVYGADFLGRSNALRQDFVGDGVATTYQTNLAYAAFSNYNWLLKVSKSTKAGTVTVTAGSKTVTGSGTDFIPEVRPGDEIIVNGEIRTVMSITSDTVLTVDRNFVAAAAAVTISVVDSILQPTEDFTVSDVGGYCLITLAAAARLPAGAKMEVHKVTPVALFTFATATTIDKQVDLGEKACDVMWYVSDATGTPSATNIYVKAAGQ